VEFDVVLEVGKFDEIFYGGVCLGGAWQGDGQGFSAGWALGIGDGAEVTEEAMGGGDHAMAFCMV
jgi:hypothetical protein